MKLINKMAAAAVLALSSAGVASAQTVVHVTGSTAYRVADVSAEVAVCGGTSAKAIYWGGSLTGSNYSIVYGTNYIFENFFNGSIAGDEALVTTGVTLAFPSSAAYQSAATNVTTAPAAPTTIAIGGQAETAPTVWPTGITTDSSAPDVAFSDVTFDTAQQIIEASSTPSSNTPQQSAIVGIVPFVFVCNGSSDVNATELTGLSMDPQKFTYVWGSGGSANLAYFTGNTTVTNPDATVTVYPLGRDVDSGTRSTALAETGYGLNGSDVVTTPVAQYYPYDNSTDAGTDQSTGEADTTGVAGFSATTGVCGIESHATSIGYISYVPQESVDGYLMTDGDGGYYSGGNLAKGISTKFATGTGAPTKTVMMCYLGVSDAVTALGGSNPAKLMEYNGASFDPTAAGAGTTNSNKIYYGQYTFWGYEHEFYKTGVASAAAGTSGLSVKLTAGLDELSSNQVTYGSMKVSRQDDGQNIQ
jgi:hypothetical protein